MFQFTLPRGERLNSVIFSTLQSGFNSRSREGSDIQERIKTMVVTQFQFTLPRGERLRLVRFELLLLLFQFTLPRGERHPTSKSRSYHSVSFNSRSREGSDAIFDIFGKR